MSLPGRSDSNASLLGGGDDGLDDLDSSCHSFSSSSVDKSKSKGKLNLKKDPESAIQQATKSLKRWRSCILLIWVLSTVVISVAAFLYLSRLEQQEFEANFRQSAQLLASSAEEKAQDIYAAWETESEDITAYTSSTKAQWPYVLIPYWEKRAFHLRQSTYTSQVTLAPLLLMSSSSETEAEQQRDFDTWQRFVTYITHNWVQEGHQIANERGGDGDIDMGATSAIQSDPQSLYQLDQQSQSAIPMTAAASGSGPYAPFWQTSPPPTDLRLVNFDVLSENVTHDMFLTLLAQQQQQEEQQQHLIMSDLSPNMYWVRHNSNDTTTAPLQSLLLQPIYDSFNQTSRKMTGLLLGVLNWNDLMNDILLPSSDITHLHGMVCILENTCGSSAIYEAVRTDDEEKSTLLQVVYRDSNNQNYHPTMGDGSITASFGPPQEHLNVSASFSSTASACHYSLHFYPTQAMEDSFTSNTPKYASVLLALVLAIFGIVFAAYIHMMQERHTQVQNLAIKSEAVISSLFPSTVRDRIMEDAFQQKTKQKKTNRRRSDDGDPIESIAENQQRALLSSGGTQSMTEDSISKSQQDEPEASVAFDKKLTNAIQPTSKGSNVYNSRPIADLFPEATVLFADIVGFTAWSSTREPCQVFDLLETIYHTFDEIAKRRNVFKIETIGDCYVCCTGIPVQRKDHAILCCKFAKDCLRAMDIVTTKLEVALGPDTSDLSMRFGLHSGPVTAGVLRGERSRFQLFGDTVNTAARMESMGKPGRIHISQETANQLVVANKGHWFIHREDKILAKGKGELQTYWLDPMAIESSATKKNSDPGVESNGKSEQDASHPTLRAAMEIEKNHHRENDACHGLLSEREQRLIDWTADQLLKLLKRIVAKREQCGQDGDVGVIPQASASQTEINVFDEVKECIAFPTYENRESAGRMGEIDDSAVELHPDVTWQLFDYVTSISTLYRSNSFHNFEHATHVCMSVLKMMKRIVDPGPNKRSDENGCSTDEVIWNTDSSNSIPRHADKGYGISSDPLCQFAVVFSALIHDVDHLGVSNQQLIKENSHLARVYKNQSVAEQNSVNIAWDMLMDPAFSELRKCIYRTEEEFIRFRQLVVNTVMATDIVDKDLKSLRNARWEKAFQKMDNAEVTKEDVDRKATIVIEHLIQASDVSHTMQHWQVYCKWNARLYRELYTAFLMGRMEKDPTTFWYQGEIGFFDFYIIPLAKKLRDCGVFGVSCDEYLNYALSNRKEWEKNGEAVVRELRESVRDLDEQYGIKDDTSMKDHKIAM